MKSVKTSNDNETRELGRRMAQEVTGGEVICLEGDLGSGKTTFTQGLLEGLGVEGPYTSPTFVVMKKYDLDGGEILNVYHIDAYRVEAEDILSLGWDEIVADKNSVTIVEWPEKLSGILPENAHWVSFAWTDEMEREISFSDQLDIVCG